MKFTIEGFSQAGLVSNGLDPIDAVILRWFVDFYASGSMSMVVSPTGIPFAWVKYAKAIEELPCTGIKTADSMARRFKKLADCGVLDHYHHTVGGSFSTFKPSHKMMSLVSSTPTDEKSEGSGSKVGAPTDEKSEQKTLLSKDSSTKDKEPKHKHGEFQHVLLTDTELEKLKKDFPLDWEQRIQRLDEYIEMKGATYKNHSLTIQNWARRDTTSNTTPLFKPKEEPDDSWRFHDPLSGKLGF